MDVEDDRLPDSKSPDGFENVDKACAYETNQESVDETYSPTNTDSTKAGENYELNNMSNVDSGHLDHVGDSKGTDTDVPVSDKFPDKDTKETDPSPSTPPADSRADDEDGYLGSKRNSKINNDDEKEKKEKEKTDDDDDDEEDDEMKKLIDNVRSMVDGGKGGDGVGVIDGRDGDVCTEAEVEAAVASGVREALSQTWHVPDGGYGWVVVMCSLVISLIVDGLTYTFGLFLGEFERAFNQPKSTIALASSLQVGVYLVIGPIVSALTNRFGCRPVIIAGSLVASLAFIISSWSPGVLMLILTYGVLGGIGFGMMYLPSIVAVSIYFEKKRAVATGIAVCGSGIGTFILAPMTEHLLYEYNWQWTILILGALILNGIVCGALIRPLDIFAGLREDGQKDVEGSTDDTTNDTKEAKIVREVKRRWRKMSGASNEKTTFENVPLITITDDTDNTRIVFVGKGQKEKTPPPPEKATPPKEMTPPLQVPNPPEKLLFSSVPNMVINSTSQSGKASSAKGSNSVTRRSDDDFNRRKSGTDILERRNRSHSSFGLGKSQTSLGSRGKSHAPLGLAFISLSDANLNKIKHDVQLPISRRDVHLSGSLAYLGWDYTFHPGDKGTGLYIQSIRSITSLGSVDGVEDMGTQSKGLWACLPQSARETMEEMLDFSILKNKRYWFVLLGNFFCMIGFYVPFVYLAQRAIQMGIKEEQAAFLLSIIGITNTVGRVLTGLVINFFNVDCVMVTSVSLVLAGIMTAMCPLCEGYVALAVVSTFFGLCVAAYISLCSVLLCDLLGVQNLTNAFGFVILFRGVACIIGPPLAGAIIDSTGVFDPAFFVGGGMIVLGGLSHLMLHLPCVTKASWDKQKEEGMNE